MVDVHDEIVKHFGASYRFYIRAFKGFVLSGGMHERHCRMHETTADTFEGEDQVGLRQTRTTRLKLIMLSCSKSARRVSNGLFV